MSAEDTRGKPAEHFRAVLLPHRSLGRKGFIVLMAVVCLISAFAALRFYQLGAWPIVGFFGLTVMLIYGAFRLNYRAAKLYELIELTASELRLTRVYPSGHAQSWSFNPYWVRLELTELEAEADRLSLRYHGRVLIFGNFLTDEEKRGFANALGAALRGLSGASA
jgi:uncharacterized membrane protein